MHYEVSKCDSTMRYEYTFDDNISCVFSVEKVGIIHFKSKEKIKIEYLCEALKEVSNITSERGLIPKMDIKNSNHFLQELVERAGFEKIPSRGISFSVWVRHRNK